MADFKQHRGIESKVQEQLYDNLFLLSKFYPTSNDFCVIFKKNMFVKNNKGAFFEVVYYLLNILNPDLTKEKLTAWPPYDIKRENKFRTEVLNYINELNVIYDNADIPHIMSSHLISPGGLKFTKFMLKLSQLVLYEHLRRTEETDILLYPKRSKNANLNSVILNNLKKKTSVIEQETSDTLKEFQSFHFNSKEKAISINNELKILNGKIREAKEENMAVREEFNRNHPSFPSQTELEEKIGSIKCQFEAVQEVRDLFKGIKSLISYINSNDRVLQHCKDKLKLPNDDVLHLAKNRDELDLTEYFQALNGLLERKALEFPYPTDSVVSQDTEKVKLLNERYSEIINKFEGLTKRIQCMSDKLMRQCKDLLGENDTEVLAVPLSDLVKSEAEENSNI